MPRNAPRPHPGLIVSTVIILNPNAGSGRAQQSATALKASLPDCRLLPTEYSGHAEHLARQARANGAGTIVAVGGDGTVQQCVTGICLDDDASPVSHSSTFAVLPLGTGGDYRKTFDWTESISALATRLETPQVRKVDVGSFSFTKDGQIRRSAFANVLSFGLGGLTDRFVERGPKWIGGRAAFLMGAMRATLVQQRSPIELKLDGQLIETAPFSNVAVCLGRYFGGGMQIAPKADPSDGLFDVVTMELDRLSTLSLALDIYRGTHLNRDGVRHYRCSKVEARSTRESECLVDADGEQLGSLPLSIEVLPGALNLLA